MTFCPNCGAAVEGRFCGKCGAAVTSGSTGASAPGTTAGATSGPAAGESYQAPGPAYQAPGAYPPPPVAQPAAGGLQENVASMLCYLLTWLTGILFLVLEPYNRNRNIRFHAFQAIFLGVAWIVLWIVVTVLSAALPFGLMILSTLLWMIVALGGLGLWIYLMVSAYSGKRVKLPIIGDLAEKQA